MSEYKMKYIKYKNKIKIKMIQSGGMLCSVCQEVRLDNNVKQLILGCHHSICSDCYTEMKKSDITMTCPLCRKLITEIKILNLAPDTNEYVISEDVFLPKELYEGLEKLPESERQEAERLTREERELSRRIREHQERIQRVEQRLQERQREQGNVIQRDFYFEHFLETDFYLNDDQRMRAFNTIRNTLPENASMERVRQALRDFLMNEMD